MSCRFRFLSCGSRHVLFHELVFFFPQGYLVVSTELAVELHLPDGHGLFQISQFGFSLLVFLQRCNVKLCLVLDFDDLSHSNRRLCIVEARLSCPQLFLQRRDRILLLPLTLRYFQQILTRISIQPFVGGNLRIQLLYLQNLGTYSLMAPSSRSFGLLRRFIAFEIADGAKDFAGEM